MELTNLCAQPDKFMNTLSLIERSFGYNDKNSFEVDFYPLMKEENRKHCWIIEDNGEVLAHSAALEKEIRIKGESFPVLFIGGVSVDEQHRGKGLSSKLLKHIFHTYPQNALYILWSDKIDMYKKYGFQPCIELHEWPQQPKLSSGFVETKIDELSADELASIKSLYQNESEIRIHRSNSDWDDIKKITSSSLYVKRKESKITNYFFINKGQDLKGVAHEYGHLDDAEEITVHGKLWSTREGQESAVLFGSLVKPGNFSMFADLIHALSGIKVSSSNESVSFSFENESYTMNMEDFLQGVLGPGRFEELSNTPKLFISGLDSI